MVRAEGTDRRRERAVDENVPGGARMLAINTGSSSLKVTKYRCGDRSEIPELGTGAERIAPHGRQLRLQENRASPQAPGASSGNKTNAKGKAEEERR